MLWTQALCRPSSQQNRQQRWSPRRQFRNLNFSPFTKKTTEYSFELFLSINKIVFDKLFYRNLNLNLPPKRQLSILLNFFLPLIKLFLTFVVSAKTRVTMRFYFGPKTRIQHRVISSVCHLILVILWCERTDGRTVAWLLHHYQNFLVWKVTKFA